MKNQQVIENKEIDFWDNTLKLKGQKILSGNT